MNATGAVLAGRRTAEQVDHRGGNPHGVPIHVVSHRPPAPSVAKYPLVTYVSDGIVSAKAKAAAGDRNVMVHGASTARAVLEAGVVDELEIHQVPVLFGGGRRLFEVLLSRIELAIDRVIDTPEATHLHYSVRRPVNEPVAARDGSRLQRNRATGIPDPQPPAATALQTRVHLGFLGTGALTSAIVKGLKASPELPASSLSLRATARSLPLWRPSFRTFE